MACFIPTRGYFLVFHIATELGPGIPGQKPLREICVFEHAIVGHCTPFVVILRGKKVNKINELGF